MRDATPRVISVRGALIFNVRVIQFEIMVCRHVQDRTYLIHTNQKLKKESIATNTIAPSKVDWSNARSLAVLFYFPSYLFTDILTFST